MIQGVGDFFDHHVTQVRDYAIAGTLTTSPVWVHWLTDFGTPVLTFVCVLTGAVVGIRRVMRDLKKPLDD